MIVIERWTKGFISNVIIKYTDVLLVCWRVCRSHLQGLPASSNRNMCDETKLRKKNIIDPKNTSTNQAYWWIYRQKTKLVFPFNKRRNLRPPEKSQKKLVQQRGHLQTAFVNIIKTTRKAKQPPFSQFQTPSPQAISLHRVPRSSSRSPAKAVMMMSCQHPSQTKSTINLT